jgi:ABC-type sugar transport system ATPase subunit
MDAISLRSIEKKFGDAVAVHPIDLDIPKGEFFTLVGPSGCGKTTTLRMIAGLERPTSGTLLVSGREMFNGRTQRFVNPEQRGLAMVFQSYALWPHMTVAQNVAFGLAGRPRREITERVGRALEMVKIGDLERRFPGELSGGQQQRVALARELVTEPEILLMDEPLSNLDAKLRIDMRAELKNLHRQTGMTIVYVTHDQIEALTMATTVVVMNEGRIAQQGTPTEVYQRPRARFVAEFVSNLPYNLLPATMADDGAIRGHGFGWPTGAFAGTGRSGDVTVGIRPESLRVDGQPGLPLPLEVVSVLPAGSYTVVQAHVAGPDGSRLYLQLGDDVDVSVGARITATVDPARVTLFDPASGLALA